MKQQPVQFCGGCGKILDEIHPANGHAPWVEARAFLVKHGFTWDDLDLVDSFCPDCRKVMETTTHANMPNTNPNAMP